MENKNYCMSSFLTFRYVEDESIQFFEGLEHENYKKLPDADKIICNSAIDIHNALLKLMKICEGKKVGIMLSGGMDSAIIASYMPKGSIAYTMISNADNCIDETHKAKEYADLYGLQHKVIPINWDDFDKYAPTLMREKGAPIHSIEVQIYKVALEAIKDGIDLMFCGESADLVFGGMDGLLAKDWSFDEYIDRYTFVDPKKVLTSPVSMSHVFERFHINNDKIDFMGFLDDIFSIESSSSYLNAFRTANLKYEDPTAKMKMGIPLDLKRIRSGESKYLLRELFKMRYPNILVPEKIPMPRAMNEWLQNWQGPKRDEFLPNCVSGLTGDQRWLIYCLEMFLNLHDQGDI